MTVFHNARTLRSYDFRSWFLKLGIQNSLVAGSSVFTGIGDLMDAPYPLEGTKDSGDYPLTLSAFHYRASSDLVTIRTEMKLVSPLIQREPYARESHAQ